MSIPSRALVTEVGPRDGFQAESEFVPSETKIALINALIDAGIPRIEFSSFVSPRAVPQLADVNEVLAGLDRTRATVLAALVPNARGAERAAEAGVDEIIVFLSASESHNRKNVNRSVDESLRGFEDVARIAPQRNRRRWLLLDRRIPTRRRSASRIPCPISERTRGTLPRTQ